MSNNMNLITSISNYIWDEPFPVGAIIQANPKQSDFKIADSTWKMTILNHTDLKIEFNSRGYATLNGLNIGSSANFEYLHAETRNSQIIAYCMEDHPQFLFLEIKKQSVSIFDFSPLLLRHFIDISHIKPVFGWCDMKYYEVCSSTEKITEISKKIILKRTKFNLILNSLKDPNSKFSEFKIPQDIILYIALQFDKALKSEIQ